MKTKKEQIENAIKWIEALLSGEYKRGKGALGNKTIGFCCWGLGCYVVGKTYDPIDIWDDGFYKWVGFNNMKGYIAPQFYGRDKLARVNDFTNAGFKRIGKYLIKHSATNFEPHVSEGIQKHFKN